jgi:hypothetical protein
MLATAGIHQLLEKANAPKKRAVVVEISANFTDWAAITPGAAGVSLGPLRAARCGCRSDERIPSATTRAAQHTAEAMAATTSAGRSGASDRSDPPTRAETTAPSVTSANTTALETKAY